MTELFLGIAVIFLAIASLFQVRTLRAHLRQPHRPSRRDPRDLYFPPFKGTALSIKEQQPCPVCGHFVSSHTIHPSPLGDKAELLCKNCSCHFDVPLPHQAEIEQDEVDW